MSTNANEPPPEVLAALSRRLSAGELQALSAVFAVRATGQYIANVVNDWMSDSAGSQARFQILIRLWAAHGAGVPHKTLVTGLAVTRATISGLMTGLERDGLVTSDTDPQDRRSQIARLTLKGEQIVEKAVDANKQRLHAAFAALSADDIATLITLLQRLRNSFQVNPIAAKTR